MAADAGEPGALIERHPLFAGLAAKVHEELLAQSILRQVNGGGIIFEQGEPGLALYGIVEGRVRIYSVGTGRGEVTLNILEAGEVFGEIAMLDGGTRTASALALEPAVLLQLRRESVLATMRRHPELAERIVLLLCRRLRWTSDLIEDAAFLPLPARLAKRLLALAQAHGQTDSRLHLRLSQRQLATLVGASREAVNKLLAQWREEGLIQLQRQDLYLKDRQALQRIVDEA